MSLVYYDLWMKRRRRRAFLGPGAASTAEFEQEHEHEHHFTGMSPARWLAVFIATGIGLHNFSEGLAIGQASAADEVSLAIVLIIGFGLHNATEGLGHLRAAHGRPRAAELGLPRAARPDRRRPDLHRHGRSGRPGSNESVMILLLRAGRRLDPLRRDGAA